MAPLQIPDNLTFDQAASVPLGLATVVLALYNHDPKSNSTLRLTPPWAPGGTTEYAGKPILILGGASSVGQYGMPAALKGRLYVHF